MFLMHPNYRTAVDTFLRGQNGFNERTITNFDTEAKNYDQAVATAKESDGFYGTHYVVFRWVVPASVRVRVLNKSILRMKLQNNGGTELPNDAVLLLGIHRPPRRFVTFFAEMIYSPWRNLAIAEQRDLTKNESCSITFIEEPGVSIPFVDFGPDDSFIIAVAGTSTLVDKDHANHIIELDVGTKSI